MISKVTSKYQTTIPAKVRRLLKLKISDVIEWKLEKGKIIVKPLENSFLKYRGTIDSGPGNIKEDIQEARGQIIQKFK